MVQFADRESCREFLRQYQQKKLAYLREREHQLLADEAAEIIAAKQEEVILRLTDIVGVTSVEDAKEAKMIEKIDEISTKYSLEQKAIEAEYGEAGLSQDEDEWLDEMMAKVEACHSSLINNPQFITAALQGLARGYQLQLEDSASAGQASVVGMMLHSMGGDVDSLLEQAAFDPKLKVMIDNAVMEVADEVMGSVMSSMSHSYAKSPTQFNQHAGLLKETQERYAQDYQQTVERLGGMGAEDPAHKTYVFWSGPGMQKADEMKEQNPDKVVTFQSTKPGVVFNCVVASLVEAGLMSWESTTVLGSYGALSFSLAEKVREAGLEAKKLGLSFNVINATPLKNTDTIFAHVEHVVIEPALDEETGVQYYTLSSEVATESAEWRKEMQDLTVNRTTLTHYEHSVMKACEQGPSVAAKLMDELQRNDFVPPRQQFDAEHRGKIMDYLFAVYALHEVYPPSCRTDAMGQLAADIDVSLSELDIITRKQCSEHQINIAEIKGIVAKIQAGWEALHPLVVNEVDAISSRIAHAKEKSDDLQSDANWSFKEQSKMAVIASRGGGAISGGAANQLSTLARRASQSVLTRRQSSLAELPASSESVSDLESIVESPAQPLPESPARLEGAASTDSGIGSPSNSPPSSPEQPPPSMVFSTRGRQAAEQQSDVGPSTPSKTVKPEQQPEQPGSGKKPKSDRPR